MVVELQTAASAGDERVIARIAHTLQSSAGNLGARRLQRLCAEAEAAANTEASAADAATAMAAELDRVISALRAERQRTAA
jgi:HPt (histidine-containing phosphotransfer) domain-containing protein